MAFFVLLSIALSLMLYVRSRAPHDVQLMQGDRYIHIVRDGVPMCLRADHANGTRLTKPQFAVYFSDCPGCNIEALKELR